YLFPDQEKGGHRVLLFQYIQYRLRIFRWAVIKCKRDLFFILGQLQRRSMFFYFQLHQGMKIEIPPDKNTAQEKDADVNQDDQAQPPGRIAPGIDPQPGKQQQDDNEQGNDMKFRLEQSKQVNYKIRLTAFNCDANLMNPGS